MSLWRPRLRNRLDRLRRYRHIVGVLMKYGLEEVAEALRSKLLVRLGERAAPMRVKKVAVDKSRPHRVRLALEELGPTFIKFGQLLSTRPDLVPAEYVHEFEQLQDQVKPDSSEHIVAEIERQFDGKIGALFAHFDPTPLAAGSIAQVHRATTLEGDSVVVKVRRPGIVDIIHAECEILEELTSVLRVTLFERETVDARRMVREFVQAVAEETNLAQERRNQLRFIKSFEDDSTIRIPRIYEKYCTNAILTMEYIDGVKPSSPEVLTEHGLDAKIVAQRGAGFVLRQVFELGFFHTDPHPGNFFLLPDNVLAPIDFGQVARLTSQDGRVLNEIILAIVDNEASRLARVLEREDMVDERTDVNKVTSDMDQLIDTYRNLPLKNIPFGKMVMQTFDLFRTNFVRPPAQFTLMLKTLATIESFARSLDPDFNIMEAMKPYARQANLRDFEPKRMLRHMRRAISDAGDLATRLPDDANAILSKFRQGKFQVRVHHEHLENLSHTVDRSSNRISFSLIIAALLVASSMLVAQDGTVLGLFTLQTMGIAGYIIAAIIGIWLLISISRSGRL